jgi:hypothetical protein
VAKAASLVLIKVLLGIEYEKHTTRICCKPRDGFAFEQTGQHSVVRGVSEPRRLELTVSKRDPYGYRSILAATMFSFAGCECCRHCLRSHFERGILRCIEVSWVVRASREHSENPMIIVYEWARCAKRSLALCTRSYAVALTCRPNPPL